MAPRRHKCLECYTELPLHTDEIECPGCGQEYRVEPAERGFRVYPGGSSRSLVEIRLERLGEWSEKQTEVTS